MTGKSWFAGAAAVGLLVCACKQEGPEEVKPAPAKQPGQRPPAAAEDLTPAPSAPSSAGATRVVEKAPPPRLYDQPVERRLYSNRIESSSFLWTDWNKFQENYHPNYLMDGDPKTAWVEGGDGSGAGEWIRVQLSPVEGVTRIRLRLQNGYHRSRSLYGKNARARQIAITTQPGGQRHAAGLADDMAWQEVVFDVPPGRVEALELEVTEAFEGTRYTDLCISELEVFLTGLTVENPAFEKSKRDELIAWKKNRLAAAALFGSRKAAAALPILPGYRVVKGELAPALPPRTELFGHALRSLVEMVPASAPVAHRAQQAVAADFAGWIPVQAVVRPRLVLPAVDGLYEPGSFELVYEPREDAFMLPSSPQGVLLSSRNLSLFDARDEKDPRQRTDCKEGRTWYMRPPSAPAGKGAGGPLPTELLMVRCVVEETREGEATYTLWQLLEFDDRGSLVLMVGPQQVQWLDWKEDGQAEGGAILSGGLRIQRPGEPVQKLVDARVAAD